MKPSNQNSVFRKKYNSDFLLIFKDTDGVLSEPIGEKLAANSRIIK